MVGFYYRIERKIITGEVFCFAKLINGHYAPSVTLATGTKNTTTKRYGTYDTKTIYILTLNEHITHTLLNIIVNIGYMNVNERILKLMRYSSRQIHVDDDCSSSTSKSRSGSGNLNNNITTSITFILSTTEWYNLFHSPQRIISIRNNIISIIINIQIRRNIMSPNNSPLN